MNSNHTDFFKDLVQIAGILNFCEAEMLVSKGIKTLGFPLRLPVNKEDVTEKEAAGIIKRLAPGIHNILITYLNEPPDIIELADFIGTNIIQLHGDAPPENIAAIKAERPDFLIIKSLIIKNIYSKDIIKTMKSYLPFADAFITDSYDPATGACGATGITHNWNISRKIVINSPKPVILAGGLTPENVFEAIVQVRPAGVDVHTGIENQAGSKNPDLVAAFLSEARKGFHYIRNCI